MALVAGAFAIELHQSGVVAEGAHCSRHRAAGPTIWPHAPIARGAREVPLAELRRVGVAAHRPWRL
jgi:hypothetical protein